MSRNFFSLLIIVMPPLSCILFCLYCTINHHSSLERTSSSEFKTFCSTQSRETHREQTTINALVFLARLIHPKEREIITFSFCNCFVAKVELFFFGLFFLLSTRGCMFFSLLSGNFFYSFLFRDNMLRKSSNEIRPSPSTSAVLISTSISSLVMSP